MLLRAQPSAGRLRRSPSPCPHGGAQLRREGGGGSLGKVLWKEKPRLKQMLLLVLGQQLQVTAEDPRS